MDALDVLVLVLTVPLSILTSLAAILMILLALAVTIELMTAGRISFGIGNDRLWRRLRRDRSGE